MITSDSSVAIAAFASWHPAHRAARSALGDTATIVAHAALETYSVLTRLPERFRAAPAPVQQFLARRFPDEPLVLPSSAHAEMLDRLASSGITGGSAYDALIAETARVHNATLLTFDHRAVLTYERLGARYEVVRSRPSG